MRSDHGQEQVLPAPRASTEDTQLAFQCLSVALRDHVGLIGEFDFANVDAVICSIEQEINLSPFFVGVCFGDVTPRRSVCFHVGDTNSIANRLQVLETKRLQPGTGTLLFVALPTIGGDV